MINLSRQSKLVPESELKKWNFEVFGVGSIGSHVVNCLAKTGFQNINVYDMDIVEDENIGPQAFLLKHLKMNKVDAIKDLVKEGADVDIIAHHGTITNETTISLEPYTMYLCFFDSVEGRKMIFNKVKELPCIFVDGRIGKFDMRHYLVDCSLPSEREKYLKSLPEGEGSDLACGEKASCMINYTIAGLIVNNIVNYVSGRNYDKIYIGNVVTPKQDIHINIERELPIKEDTPILGDEEPLHIPSD